MYYNPTLLQEDEVQLREAFVRLNETNEATLKYARGAFFLGYWPLTYVLSRQVRPAGVLAWSLVYYFGFYRYGAVNYISNSLQAGLNNAAVPFAKKYNIRTPEEYAQ